MPEIKKTIWLYSVAWALILSGCLSTVGSDTTEAPSRIVAIGDIHGNYEGFKTILTEAGMIDEKNRWIGGNAVLVQTGDFLDRVMSHITLPGSVFLAILAVFPAIVVKLINIQPSWALFYGGTSLLIMVGVAIDTVQQVNAYLLNRHYDGLMKTGKNRKVA